MASPPDMTRHTRRYWLIDGLPELFMGGFFLLFSALQLAVRFVPAHVTGFVQLLIPVFVLVFCLGVRPVLQAIKNRTTYPYTGYIEYPQPGWRSQALAVVLGFVLTALLLAWSFTVPVSAATLPVLVGVGSALMMLCLGSYLGARRFYVLAAISLLAGFGVLLLPVDGHTGYLLVFAVLGLWLLVSGARTLQHYRRTYAAQE